MQLKHKIFHNFNGSYGYGAQASRAGGVPQGPRKPLMLDNTRTKRARAGIPRRKVLRVRLKDSVMKFGYAWTSVNKTRGETPAPPEERAPAVPRRRLARGIRIGPPHPNWLVSACRSASKFGSEIQSGGVRPFMPQQPVAQLQVSTVSLRSAGKQAAHWNRILELKNCIFRVGPYHG